MAQPPDAFPRKRFSLGWTQGRLCVCFLGFSLVIALSTSTSLFSGGSGLSDIGWLTSLARMATFASVALASRRIGPLSLRPAILWSAVALATLGVACVICAARVNDAPIVLHACGRLGMAVGYALLYLFWIELYAKMDLPHVAAYFSAVHLVSAVISFVLSMISERWFVEACLVMLPALCALLYKTSLARSATVSYMQGEKPAFGWSFPIRPVILLATFTLANNFIRHFLSIDLRAVVLVGVMLAAAATLALITWKAERFNPGTLYSLCLPLIVAGSLCVLIPLGGFGAAGGILSNAAYTLFSIFVTVLLCNISYRNGVNAPWLFGITNASITLGSLAAGLLAKPVDQIDGDPAVLHLIVSVVILVFVCLYVMFPGKDALSGTWGITRTGFELDARDSEENLVEQAARLSRVYGLTRREEEVLLLLVQDVSFAQIEDVLSITNSTLKTHARHIYSKFAVSGRRELADACKAIATPANRRL